jgi:hypothetical protein
MPYNAKIENKRYVMANFIKWEKDIYGGARSAGTANSKEYPVFIQKTAEGVMLSHFHYPNGVEYDLPSMQVGKYGNPYGTIEIPMKKFSYEDNTGKYFLLEYKIPGMKGTNALTFKEDFNNESACAYLSQFLASDNYKNPPSIRSDTIQTTRSHRK